MYHRRRHDLAAHGVDLGFSDRLRCDNLYIDVRVGHNRAQSVVVEAGQVVRLKTRLIIPVALQYASLADQRVLECRVNVQEAVVVAVDDVVGVFRRLLGSRDILRPLGRVFDGAVGAMENAHQRRHDRLNGVAHVHADNLAAALFLIAERLAAVVLRRCGACGANPVIDKVDCVVDLFANDAL